MQISFDPVKRAATLVARDLDFGDAAEVFAGPVFESEDRRFGYGEIRMITVGLPRDRLVVLVWTARGTTRHIISIRKANDREQARYQSRLG